MHRVLIQILLVAILSACANVSRFERNSLIAHGELLDGSHELLYYSIWVNFEKSIDLRTTSSLLKFSPDSPAFALKELRPKLVARYLPPFTPPLQWPDAWKQKAKDSPAYTGGGFHISFNKEGQLISVGICSHCAEGRENPIVGAPDGQRFYMLPLTEQQIREVFGPPDRTYKVHEVRY